MVTKQELINDINSMLASSSVSIMNKGAFLLKLFLYSEQDQKVITKNLVMAARNVDSSNNIIIISIDRLNVKEFKYQYLISYQLKCSLCDKISTKSVNLSSKYFSMMCESCQDGMSSPS